MAFSKPRLQRLSDAMRRYTEDGTLAGVVTLLHRNGETILEAHGVQDHATKTKMCPDTIFRIASMSKPIAGTAAMLLVEQARLRLDDPIDRYLPELANRKVLRTPTSALDDTIPAKRPLTLRDLLTFRLGYGIVMEFPPISPFPAAFMQSGLMPGAIPPQLSPDEFMRRLGELPLLHQPGEGWLYHTGSDVLGILIARLTGTSLENYLSEQIFQPLGMTDTAFSVPETKTSRLATAYHADGSVFDLATGGHFAKPPIFQSAGGGLVSTADDYLAFAHMLLDQGQPLLSHQSVALMTRNHIALEQQTNFAPGFWETTGWGFCVSVVTNQPALGPNPGSFGWTGGLNTVFCCDPIENMIAIFLAQRLMTSPTPDHFIQDFWTLAYQAIDN